MKLLLFACVYFCLASNLSAQYKDSLKTFRKLTKSYQKSSDYVFIPSGSYSRGSNDSDLPTPDMNGYYFRSHVVSVDSFFMGKFEISNEKYLEFVAAMIQSDSIEGKTYLPDTLVWRRPLSFGEKYVDYYLRHPAYRNYPVVGVSYAKAKAYAEWQTQKYNADEERHFKKVLFRIPTEEEWELASRGKTPSSYLPWNSRSTLDENGQPRANFKVVSQLSIYRDSISQNDPSGEMKKRRAFLSTGMQMSPNNELAGNLLDSDVTAHVDAYEPNSYGLYQMAGNLAEMVDAYYFRDAEVYSFVHDVLQKSEIPWGVTKGGSWNDTGYYLQYPVRQFYEDQNSTSGEIGFRLVMQVLEY